MMRRLGWQGQQVLQAGTSIGYCYVHDGVLGPVAWTAAPHVLAVLGLGLREAAAGGGLAQLMAHGLNPDALRFAFGAGMRLTSCAHLLMSRGFGHLDRYLPSGALMF